MVRVDASPFPPERAQAIIAAHDLDGMQAMEQFQAALPWGAEALRLGRALAAYEDQRGWRARARDRYTALLARAGAASDRQVQARLHLDLATMADRWHDYTAMAGAVGAAEVLLAGDDNRDLTIALLLVRAQLASEQRRFLEAQHDAARALLLIDHADWPARARALNVHCEVIGRAGHHAAAARYTTMALAGDLAALDTRLQASIHLNHGYMLRRVKGDEAAVPHYERALELHLERRDPLGRRTAAASLGMVYARLGRVRDAEEIYAGAIGALDDVGAGDQAGVLLNNLAQLRFERGDLEGARAAFEQSFAVQRRLGNLRGQAIACANLGHLWSRQGDPVQAADWWERGSAAHAEQGNFEEAIKELGRASAAMRPIDPRRAQAIDDRVVALRAADAAARGRQFEAFFAALRGLLEAPVPDTAALHNAVQELAVAAEQAADGALCAEAQERLVPLLATLPLAAAGHAALACARLVEHGAPPASTLSILITRLKDCLSLAAAHVVACENAGIDVHAPPSDLAVTEPCIAWNALGWLCAALEIILSHTPAGRLAARADRELRSALDALPHAHPSPLRVRTLLDVLDDEELLVLHPALGKGFRVWVSGIATGRQLHTLLADALIGDPAQGLLPGTRPDPRVVALARGQPARTVDTSGLSAHPDVCLLNLLSWHHLRPDGALKPGTVTLLWPSSTLAEIVPFEGLRVVLLGPPAMQLAWSTAREFRHMAAEVRLLEILDAATVRAWLARMATAPR